MENTHETLRRFFEQAVTNPSAAADELERVAAKLMEAARKLRQRETEGMRSKGGVSDRVQMRVVGPDGKTKQSTDTGV